MPKDSSIRKVLVIGAGPIVIGQACEFDYAGMQACAALKEENCYVILINSNPATIMTDPDVADATYIEPITCETIEKIIIKEKPDAILPIVGGQTALNCAMQLHSHGILQKYQIKLIGVSYDTIVAAENRDIFRKIALKAGIAIPTGKIAHTIEEASAIKEEIGLPLIIRHSFALGGEGSGIVTSTETFELRCRQLFSQPSSEGVLIEESIAGWKEFELEIMIDCLGNAIVVCSIENVDPLGIHTGDSITVAPAQTLTDKDYQRMRQAAFLIAKKMGMTTGGCNVQFAIHPASGRMIIIEINPRVSRSSALASKATGFPIAKIAAKLALGYTLDELKNTATSPPIPASFEPMLDYVVTKIPRFHFEKFPGADPTLTTEMKSVGEVMAIGRNFQESIQKAICSLEIGSYGFDKIILMDKNLLEKALSLPTADRLWMIGEAFRQEFSVDKIHQLTQIDPWFLYQIEELIQDEEVIKKIHFAALDKNLIWQYKQKGFSDNRLATLVGVSEKKFRSYRNEHAIHPVYKRIDTCAAEFDSVTTYFYSTYDYYTETALSKKQKILIIGSGPNRIGQSLEFDYCCVQAAFALRELGYESIMVNCNPETVSTDYDISDKLYFEPLTIEHILEIIAVEKPLGVMAQFGGQTSLHLAIELEKAGVKLIGLSADVIDITENRQYFKNLLYQLNLKQPTNITFITMEEAFLASEKINYPLVIRPSYILGGQACALIKHKKELEDYLKEYFKDKKEVFPILMEEFLENALEIEVDALTDGENVFIGGILEQFDKAGIHSGDSSAVIPTMTLSKAIQAEIKHQTTNIIKSLSLIGLINIQFAIKNNEIYVLEVNPRASRTIPFVSKAIGISLVKIATYCLLGYRLQELDVKEKNEFLYYFIKMPIFPFKKFVGSQSELSMEMKSTGEIMGMGKTLADALFKAEMSVSNYHAIDKKHWHVFPSEPHFVDDDIISLQEIIKITA